MSFVRGVLVFGLALVCLAAVLPASAVCLPSGRSCGLNTVTNDRLCCPGMVCGWGNVCQPGCRVNGVFYPSGAKNPANACQTCKPSVATTRWTSLPTGTACGSSSPSVCDRPDTCNAAGTCSLNYAALGTRCRGAQGGCDVEEYCTGTSAACPPDGKSTQECRASAGDCDPAESCNGTSNDCPQDAKSTRPCRPSAGACDPAESCDGASNDCPQDAKSTQPCRSSAGACDPAESCDGVAADCPPDEKSSMECRASTATCDPAERCDGVSDVCPDDFDGTGDVTQPDDPIVATSNNSPGSEGVDNAIDNQPTKYLNFDKLNTGFTVTPGVGSTLVRCLTLTSANDAPERDPASFTLEGSNDGTSFTPISAGPVPVFPSRFFKHTIPFTNVASHLAYRLIFPTVADPATANSMQISEVELLCTCPDCIDDFDGTGDVTQPGDPIVATSNNSPGSQGVDNAIDNQPTKYLNFDKLNTGFTVTPQVGSTLVRCLTLTSANDAPERDPASFTLEGSNDGTSFTPISAGPVPVFPSRFFKHAIPFANSASYLAYRLIFPTVADPATANSMQISEVELLCNCPD